MNKLILIIAAVGLLAASHFVFQHKSTPITEEIQRAFERFQYIHGKQYNDNEAVYRLNVFANNFNKVAALNAANDGAKYAMNKFSDLTAAEFKSFYLGTKITVNKREVNATENTLNAAVDWTTKGDVQTVKDQGQCGSCWAFSAVGSMESEAAIHGSGLGNFAEQQLVDCSRSYGNYGCNGGLMDYAFDYVKDHGITNESNYKYTARDGKCQIDSGDFKITGYTDVKQSDCAGLATALQTQPIAVAVDAESWQFYSGGVFSNCGKSLDHGVLLVGVDDSNVWKIKNSWGTSWGEKGFIRLAAQNTCGICLAASWPKI